MKKVSKLALSVLLIMVIALAGCAKTQSDGAMTPKSSDGAAAAPKKNVTIKMFQFKVEIAEQLQLMVNEYEKATGVKVQIETVGGGADYGAALKAKFNSGDKPDIFNNGGYSDLDLWMDQLEDLTDQP